MLCSYKYIVQMIIFSFTDVDTKFYTDTSPLIMGAIGGVMCLIIVSQSLVIVLLLQQNRRFRFDSSIQLLTPCFFLTFRATIKKSNKVETSTNSAYGVLPVREDPVYELVEL